MNSFQPNQTSQLDFNNDVFRMSRGFRIILYVVVPPLLILLGWYSLQPFIEGRTVELRPYLIGFVLGGGIALFLAYGLVSAIRNRLEVTSEYIRLVTPLRAKQIQLNIIEGVRVLKTPYIRTLVFESSDPAVHNLKVELSFERKSEFVDWVYANFDDLDERDKEDEFEELMSDSELGVTTIQRLDTLNLGRKRCRALNITATAACLWALFRPRPYDYAIWTCVLIPLIAVALVVNFRGIIKFDAREGSAYPTVAVAFIMPICGLVTRAIYDWEILSWHSFWIPFSAFTLAPFLVILVFDKGVRQKVSEGILILFFCAVYGYGTTISLNGILDNSDPQICEATVINKRISNEDHPSRFLELSTWGPREQREEVEVSKNKYETVNIGDTVEVYVFQGKFNVPWFRVRVSAGT